MTAFAVPMMVGLTGASVVQSHLGRQDAKKANRLQQRQAQAQEARERLRTVARSRQLRAATIAQGELSGVSGGSSVQGATSSLQSQAGGAIGFQQQMASFNQAINRRQEAANSHMTNANTFQALGSLAYSFRKTPQIPKAE